MLQQLVVMKQYLEKLHSCIKNLLNFLYVKGGSGYFLEIQNCPNEFEYRDITTEY